jgi:hypothetical protein
MIQGLTAIQLPRVEPVDESRREVGRHDATPSEPDRPLHQHDEPQAGTGRKAPPGDSLGRRRATVPSNQPAPQSSKPDRGELDQAAVVVSAPSFGQVHRVSLTPRPEAIDRTGIARKSDRARQDRAENDAGAENDDRDAFSLPATHGRILPGKLRDDPGSQPYEPANEGG